MDAATLNRFALDRKASRTYVLRGDRIERAEGLDRGGPIVWSVEEWRSRYRAVRRRELWLMFLLFLCLVVVLNVLFWLLSIRDDMSIRDFVDSVLISLLILVGFPIMVLADIIADRMPQAASHRGLYERGIQVNRSLFLPFEELGEVVVEGGFARLVPRTPLEKRQWLVTNPQQWSVELMLLGDEGLRELKARVTGERPGEEAPKLVLHGPPGNG